TPSQCSGASQASRAPRQTTVVGTSRSSGHSPETPSQLSGMSHSPPAARQSLPAGAGSCAHAPPRQTSFVHRSPSGSHGVPPSEPGQSGGTPQSGHSSLEAVARATTRPPSASKQSTGIQKASIVGVTATTSAEIVIPATRSHTVFVPVIVSFDGSQVSAGGAA